MAEQGAVLDGLDGEGEGLLAIFPLCTSRPLPHGAAWDTIRRRLLQFGRHQEGGPGLWNDGLPLGRYLKRILPPSVVNAFSGGVCAHCGGMW